MKTLKELSNWLDFNNYNEFVEAYYEWYKDAIEWIFNDIVNLEKPSAIDIQIYLQNLITK